MKRVLSFVLILALIVPVFLVPVLAAEVYEFYHAPVVLPEFDRIEGGFSFISESIVDNGTYVLTVYDDGTSFSSYPFVVEYSVFDDANYKVALCDVTFSSSVIVPVGIVCSPGYGTLFGFLNSDGVEFDRFPMAQYLTLDSVESGGLSSVVSSDLLGGILDEVVALTPLLLGVIVLALCIRKGIGFLASLIRGS